MYYSNKLIEKVKEIYPNWIEVHRHAEKGNVILGRFLQDSMPCGITALDVIKATSLEELKKEAEIILNKQRLYDLWCQEMAAYNTRPN